MGRGGGGFEKGRLDLPDNESIQDPSSIVQTEEAKADKSGKRSWKVVVHTPLENRIEARARRRRAIRAFVETFVRRRGTGRTTRARSTTRGRRTGRTASRWRGCTGRRR